MNIDIDNDNAEKSISNNSDQTHTKNSNALWPGFDKYFEIMEKNISKFIVRCLLCKDSSKRLSTSKKSSFNLKNHIKVI